MDKSPLHLKYRPKTFDEFVGNESTIESLKNTLANTKQMVRSFLLHGPSGCGKTTLARIIKTELNCGDRDFYEYNIANTRGIDTIREIISSSIYSPIAGPVKIYLMDECHKLTNEAQNSLLKILEDTPDHIRFILCTTDPQKLLVTIRNRCMAFGVSPLITPKLVYLLKLICQKETIDIGLNSIREIAKVSLGSPRQAVMLLGQVASLSDKSDENIKKVISNGFFDESQTIELCRALLKKDWQEIVVLLKGITADPETVRYAILGYFTTILLKNPSDSLANSMLPFTESFMNSGRAGLVLACYFCCK